MSKPKHTSPKTAHKRYRPFVQSATETNFPGQHLICDKRLEKYSFSDNNRRTRKAARPACRPVLAGGLIGELGATYRFTADPVINPRFLGWRMWFNQEGRG